MKKRSTKRQREDRERRSNLEAAYGPKPWRCRFKVYWDDTRDSGWRAELPLRDTPSACYGDVNGHEIHKSSQGGSRSDPANVIPLCNYHNDWLEDHPLLGRLIGLVRNPNKGE